MTKLNYIKGSKFFKVYQNLVIRHLFLSFLPNPFHHLKTHLWMIIMESKIVMVLKYSPFEKIDNF